jgi:hypothetical protein
MFCVDPRIKCHIGLWVQCQIQGQKACLLMSWPDTNMSVLRLLVSAITTLIHRAIPHTSGLNFMVAREATEKRRIQSDSELYVWNFEALIVWWRKLRTETKILVWTPNPLNSFSHNRLEQFGNVSMVNWNAQPPQMCWWWWSMAIQHNSTHVTKSVP